MNTYYTHTHTHPVPFQLSAPLLPRHTGLPWGSAQQARPWELRQAPEMSRLVGWSLQWLPGPQNGRDCVQKLQVCKDWCVRPLSVQGFKYGAPRRVVCVHAVGWPPWPGHVLHAGSRPQLLSPPHLAQPPALSTLTGHCSQFLTGKAAAGMPWGLSWKESLRQVWESVRSQWKVLGRRQPDSWSCLLGAGQRAHSTTTAVL